MIALSALAAEDLEALRAAHTVMLDDPALQHDFEAAVQKNNKTPEWWLTIARVIRDFFIFIEPLIDFVFKAGLIVLACFVAFGIYRLVRARLLSSKPEDEEPQPYVPSRALARTLLEDADMLAAKGLFEEAVHLLLFRSIEDIEKHRPNTIHMAMTSREISELSILPQGSRGLFAKIAYAVEQSRFAGNTLNEAAFNACRVAYEQFALPEEWR